MNRNLGTSLIALIALTLLVGVVFGSTHRVEIMRVANVNGVELKPGNYQVSLTDENTAEIYKGKKLLVRAKVEIQPLGAETPGSVTQGVDGKVKEIRLKDEKIVFVGSAVGSGSGH